MREDEIDYAGTDPRICESLKETSLSRMISLDNKAAVLNESEMIWQ